MASHKVKVSCPHCGDSTYDVDDSMAVPGVPATHVQAAVDDHESSTTHFMKSDPLEGFPSLGKKSGDSPRASGKLIDFTHGKDHNA